MSSISTFPTLLLLHLETVVFKGKRIERIRNNRIEMGVYNFKRKRCLKDKLFQYLAITMKTIKGNIIEKYE